MPDQVRHDDRRARGLTFLSSSPPFQGRGSRGGSERTRRLDAAGALFRGEATSSPSARTHPYPSLEREGLSLALPSQPPSPIGAPSPFMVIPGGVRGGYHSSFSKGMHMSEQLTLSAE